MAVAPAHSKVWAEAQRRHGCQRPTCGWPTDSVLHPKELGRMTIIGQERWKAPLPQFIEDLYARRFDRLGRPQIVTPELPITSAEPDRRLIEKADVLPRIRHCEPARGDARCTANR